MTTSDEDLALAAAGGDGDAFEALLTRVYDRLFGLAFRLTGSRAEAEDLTQDICAALPAKLSQYRGDARVTTWLYRVVVNAANDRRRRAASYGRALEGWANWAEGERQSMAEAREAEAWLHAAMTTLPDPIRDTLALALSDLTHGEIGRILGLSEGTISWRISEAKRLLREIKEKEEAQ